MHDIIEGLEWQCCYNILSWERYHCPAHLHVVYDNFLFPCNHVHLAIQQQKYALPVNRIDFNLI